MKVALRPSLFLACALVMSPAIAEEGPYASWKSKTSDDDTLTIRDSFNHDRTDTVTTDVDVRKHYEANERTDIDVDKRYESNFLSKSDDDYTSTKTVDIDDSWSQSTALDLQVVTPTLTSDKEQYQSAGHSAYNEAYGQARGHSVGVEGGTTVVNAANDKQVFLGGAMVNNNVNQLPQNNLFLQGGSMGPISQGSTFAGRDLGPKGVFGPVGNTSAAVMGNVGQTSGASVDQSGNAANSIADPISSEVSK